MGADKPRRRLVTAAELGLTDKRFLTPADVAAVFTAQRQLDAPEGVVIAPMPEKTVLTYLSESKPRTDAAARKRRYEDTPMPMPEYISGRPVWLPRGARGSIDALVRRLLMWFVYDRPGKGAGGGPKPKPAEREDREDDSRDRPEIRAARWWLDDADGDAATT